MKKLITDKTLAAFEKWFYEKHGNCSKKYEELLQWQKSEIMDWVFNACETIQHAFLIEFFDSVGIYIQPKRFTHCLEFQDWYFIITDKKGIHLNNFLENRIKIDSRQQATEQAIIKANEIYNEK